MATPTNAPEGTSKEVFFNSSQVVGQIPVTSGGLSISRTISAATTNSTSVKATPGQVYGIAVNNINAAVRYLKLYDKATAPTVGTDTPVMTISLPATSSNFFPFPLGVAFTLGIGFGLTTGLADNDTNAVSASEHVVNVLYK